VNWGDLDKIKAGLWALSNAILISTGHDVAV